MKIITMNNSLKQSENNNKRGGLAVAQKKNALKRFKTDKMIMSHFQMIKMIGKGKLNKQKRRSLFKGNTNLHESKNQN